MPTNVNAPDTPSIPAATKRASSVTKLVQAAALAAALVPLGSVAMEGASITCGFSGFDGSTSGCGESSTSSTGIYDFGPYKVVVTFVGMTGDFSLEVNDNSDIPITQETFDGLVSPLLGGYDCVTLVAPTSTDPGCRIFSFTSSSGEEQLWESYTTLFAWDFETDNPDGEGPYPNGVPDESGLGNIRVLHAPGTSSLFTVDMCLEALAEESEFAYSECAYLVSSVDPAIRSGDTRFSDMSVSTTEDTAVPEPASLVLLGTGLAAILHRKRRSIGL